MNTVSSSVLIAAYMTRRPALRRFLVARLGNGEDADDALQDLFLKIKRSELACEIDNAGAYLFRAAMNIARDLRRERARANRREADWSDAHTLLAGDEAAADVPAADEAYGAKQKLAAVKQALEELSPQCRRVVTLHKFEGLTHREVAARLGITQSTVEKHMHTALRHLVARLGRG